MQAQQFFIQLAYAYKNANLRYNSFSGNLAQWTRILAFLMPTSQLLNEEL